MGRYPDDYTGETRSQKVHSHYNSVVSVELLFIG